MQEDFQVQRCFFESIFDKGVWVIQPPAPDPPKILTSPNWI